MLKQQFFSCSILFSNVFELQIFFFELVFCVTLISPRQQITLFKQFSAMEAVVDVVLSGLLCAFCLVVFFTDHFALLRTAPE